MFLILIRDVHGLFFMKKAQKEVKNMIEDGNGNEKHAQFSVRNPNEEDTALAEKIAAWTASAGSMIPKTPEDILKLFQAGNSVVVMNNEGREMSHGAITYTYPDGSVEVGGVYTDSELRGQGGGTRVIKETIALAKKKYPGKIIFALANEASAPIFEKLGATEMQCAELDQEVWEPCAQCPRNPQLLGTCTEFKCCDTPYNLTHIEK